MQVGKWGNSLAVRLPASIVEALQLREGDEIEIELAGDRAFRIGRDTTRRDALARLQALAWVPIIRLVGDGAKMVGYPVGVVWRLRRRRFAHALHRRFARRA